MQRTNPAVRQIQQPDTKICWATCVLMAIEVKRGRVNPDITPESIVDREMGQSLNIGGFDYHTKVALESYGASNVQIFQGPAPWATIQHEIGRNRPIIISYKWAGSGGHQMVIGGWEVGTSNIEWVALNDPLQTIEKRINYERLVRGNYDPDGHRGEGNTWARYYTFD